MVPYVFKAASLWFGHFVVRLFEEILGEPVQGTEPPVAVLAGRVEFFSYWLVSAGAPQCSE
jgi:hypothetical protein